MSTILIIEDSEGQRAEIRAALEESCLFDRIAEATDGIKGLKLLLSESPDLVLCDLEMPGLDGEKLLRMNQSVEHAENLIPFLVLTAVGDPARRVRLLEQGASDVIIKPFHTADLIARIGLHKKLVETRHELIEKNHELSRLSQTDPLTGLANRRQLDEKLDAEVRRARRYKIPFAVALADIDHFKRVNDEFGHLVGDEVLVRVADSLRRILRDTDCGGRFGGEEFLVLLACNDAAGGAIFAERWRESVESLEVFGSEGEPVLPRISIGVAQWDPELESTESLIRAADQALYRAKSLGRNRVCVYSVEEDAEA